MQVGLLHEPTHCPFDDTKRQVQTLQVRKTCKLNVIHTRMALIAGMRHMNKRFIKKNF